MDIFSGDPSSITGEEVSRLTSNFRAISCETNSYRDVSPSVEPFIPERVQNKNSFFEKKNPFGLLDNNYT